MRKRRRREDSPEGCHFLQQSVNFIFILVQLQERTENKADTLHTCTEHHPPSPPLYPLGSLTLNCLSSSLWERGEMYRRWMISLRRLSVATTPSPTPCV